MNHSSHIEHDEQTHWKPQEKSVLRYFLLYFSPLFLIISLVFAALIYNDYSRTLDLINANERLQVNIIKKTLVRDLSDIGPDLRILLNSDAFQDYLATGSSTNRQKLENAFSLFAHQRRLYAQIRFIDASGDEQVRIDYDNERVSRTTDEQMQNKADRYYFIETMKIERGDIYVSPLDLNVELGKIEVPYKPVMRFATPVYDADNNKRGILILNYLANRMLHHFDELLEGTWGHIELLNQDGYWIRSHEKHREWAFMFGRETLYKNIHGIIWQNILLKDHGSIRDNRALYNFTTIDPLATVRESIRFIPEFGKLVHKTEHRVWKLISDVSNDVTRKRLVDHIIHISGPIWSLFILILLFGSWRYATHHVKNLQLQLEAELHARVFSWTTEGVIITDAQSNILDVNNGFTRITGYARKEVIGKNPRILSSGRHDESFYNTMWTQLKENGFWEGEIYNRRQDGALYYEWLHIAAVFDRKKHVINYIAVFSDITHIKDSEEELIRQAYEDPLTKLGNRLALDTFLDDEIARSHRHGTGIVLLYLDLNAFKPINDTYGHAVGDIVLREVSNRLQAHARETDKAIRIGGDEFALVLTDIDEHARIDDIISRIVKSIEQDIRTTWGHFSIGVSVGRATFPDDADNKKALIEIADRNMYQDKRANKAER